MDSWQHPAGCASLTRTDKVLGVTAGTDNKLIVIDPISV